MSEQQQIAIPRRLAKLLKQQGEQRLISRADADKCAVIVREMLKHINRRDTFKSWVNFSRDKFFELAGQRTYARVLDYLEQSKVIYRTSSYYAGNGEDLDVEPFTKAVCIDENYRSHSNCVFWNLSTKHSINSVEKTFKIKTRTSTAKALTEMFGEFQLNVNGDDATNLSDGYAWSLENVRSIQSQRYFVTEDRFSGRIHSSFTQLSGVFRERLTVNGKAVHAFDISAMQPLLLGFAARENLSPDSYTLDRLENNTQSQETQLITGNKSLCNPKKDIEAWINDCQSSQIYEKIKSLVPERQKRYLYTDTATQRRFPVDLSRMSRNAFKTRTLSVLFDRNEQSAKDPIWQTIAMNYPSIARYIWGLKVQNYTNAARLSQAIEVKLLIHTIAAEHIRQGIPIVTVHDELITPAPRETLAITQRAFNDFGLTPGIKQISMDSRNPVLVLAEPFKHDNLILNNEFHSSNLLYLDDCLE